MELATTRNPVQEAVNVSRPVETLFDFPWVRSIFRRLRTAIGNGPEHPCWRSHDAFTQVVLLPPHAANRLLDSGCVTRKGES